MCVGRWAGLGRVDSVHICGVSQLLIFTSSFETSKAFLMRDMEKQSFH